MQEITRTRALRCAYRTDAENTLIRQRAQVRAMSDDELVWRVQRRIRDMLGELDFESLTPRECYDLMGLLKQMLDRRGGSC